jgi:16S rRNA (guanine(966)-N(2))-methyltransferase RsmD
MRIVAGTARGRKIEAPAGDRTRPTLDRVRENLFNMLQGYIDNSTILDLFAGSGALSFEAISRGASLAVLVDSDRKAYEIQNKNAEHLGFTDRISCYCCDWHRAVPDLYKRNFIFDIIFLDPPYAITDMTDVFNFLIPVMTPNTILILEHQTGKHPLVPEQFEIIKQRSWGFCSVNFYRLSAKEEK